MGGVNCFFRNTVMSFVKSDLFVGYFGDASDDLRHQGEYDFDRFVVLQRKLNAQIAQPIDTLFFLKQTHSATIFVLDDLTTIKKPFDLFQYEGDAIITA